MRARLPHARRSVAPAPVRVLPIALVAAVLAAVVGGTSGFWVALPAALLACSIPATGLGAICAAGLVMSAAAAADILSGGGSVPPAWLAVAVAGGSTAVLRAVMSRLRRERDAMELAAFSDPLTGVANRRMLMAMADYEIARHRRAREPFTLVMLDLDGFKLVNDRHGHAAGDQMLRELASRLTRALRSQDTIARLGGDEFCVIAPQTDEPRALVEKIVSAVTGAADAHRDLAASVGLAVFPRDAATIDELLGVADERLLSAKRRLHGTAGRRAA